MAGSGERGDTDETIAAAHDVATMAAPGFRAIGEGATQLAEASSSRDTAGVGRTADPLSTGVRAIVERSREEDQTVGRERYRDGRLIGEGGMGRVLEAEDLQFGRLVALKEMRGHGAAEDRFGLEAVITANLEHPGIPAVYERGRTAKGPFYAMRLIKGQSLSDAIRGASTLEEKLRLLPVVLDVANTVAYAHEHGVIHRDLKPDNVVVGAHGDTVVVDWGLAKLRGVGDLQTTGRLDSGENSGATHHGSVLGTPSYMPPEQAGGRVDEIDERSDVFSLGAIVYQLFCGRAPYAGGSSLQRVALAIDCRPEPLAKLAPDTPETVLRLVEKAMRREQRDRFRNAGEFARALEDLIAGGLMVKEPRSLRIFADVVSWIFLLFTFGTSVVLVLGMWASGELDLGGIATPVMLVSFVIGVATSVLDYRTRGKHELSPLVLGMAGATIITALTFTVIGFVEVFAALEQGVVHDIITNDLDFLRGLAGGGQIALLPLMLGLPLFLAQLAIWLVVRRIVIRARARGMA